MSVNKKITLVPFLAHELAAVFLLGFQRVLTHTTISLTGIAGTDTNIRKIVASMKVITTNI